MIYRATDIEAVVDESAWTRPDPAWRWEMWSEVSSELRTYETPVGEVTGDFRSATMRPRLSPVEAFPPSQGWRVVAISCVDVEFDPASPRPYAYKGARSECLWAPGAPADVQDARERELLVMFSDAMARNADLPAGAAVNLVTWNGRGYDLPVIMMRCLKHGISCGWYYKPRNMRYRYTDEGHLDLMDYLGDFGAVRNMKLSDVAHLVGLPGKTDTRGDQVADLYAEAAKIPEREPEVRARIARYCLQDTVQTALILLRVLVLRGMLAPAACDLALDTFAESEVVRRAIDVDWSRVKLGGTEK